MNTAIDTPRKRLEFIFSETANGNWQPFVDALAEDAEWTVIGSTSWREYLLLDICLSRRIRGGRNRIRRYGANEIGARRAAKSPGYSGGREP